MIAAKRPAAKIKRRCLGLIDTGLCIVECRFNAEDGSIFCEKHLKNGEFNNIHRKYVIKRGEK